MGGSALGLALDEMTENDLSFNTDDINFVMDKSEYEMFGDITIEDNGHGFRVVGEKTHPNDGGCAGSCSGCGCSE